MVAVAAHALWELLTPRLAQIDEATKSRLDAALAVLGPGEESGAA
jgi:hypothetical protein